MSQKSETTNQSIQNSIHFLVYSDCPILMPFAQDDFVHARDLCQKNETSRSTEDLKFQNPDLYDLPAVT